MSMNLPICLPYLLHYDSYGILKNKSKNLIEIIKYGDNLLQKKKCKNITEIIKILRLEQQPELFKKLQKKYAALQKKTQNPFSWKNKASITIPKSLTQSFLPITKSIVVSGIRKKKLTKKKNPYSVKKSSKARHSLKKQKIKKKGVSKKQIGGSQTMSPKKERGASSISRAPSLEPRSLLVEPKMVPGTPSPKLLTVHSYIDKVKEDQRSLFRLDFELPDKHIQKLFFKVSIAPPTINKEISLSSPLARCTDFRKCNVYMYESNIYHTMNLKTKSSQLNQNILNLFGFGYTSELEPTFIVKYDKRKKRIVGTHIPSSDTVQEIELHIPEETLTQIKTLFSSLVKEEATSTYISYNITEFLDNYIPMRYSKKINTEDKIVKVILTTAAISNDLYHNYGFVHGDLHYINYLVKDIDIPAGNLPTDMVKFYDFDLSLLIHHQDIKYPVEDKWLGYVHWIYNEIYEGLLQNNLILFGKLLSVYDFYRIFCNCDLKYPDGSSIFDFVGMTFFKDVYLKELSDGKYEIKPQYFLKLYEEKTTTNDLHLEVLKLSLEFKNEIIDDENNKKFLLNRFTPEEYQIVKKLLIAGFVLDREIFRFTLPWWFTIWCIWTDNTGNFIS